MRNDHTRHLHPTFWQLAVVLLVAGLLAGSGMIWAEGESRATGPGEQAPSEIAASLQHPRGLTAIDLERLLFGREPFCTQEECDMYCGGMGTCIGDFCACY